VRDPSAEDYPEVKAGMRPTKWWVYGPEELTHFGLMVRVRWHYAYVDPRTGEWDAADAVGSMERHHPWRVEDPAKEDLNRAASSAWQGFTEDHRGWLKVSGFIPLRNIIAVDEMGDDVFAGTHVYASFSPVHGPFDSAGFWARLETTSKFDGTFEAAPEKRISHFAPELRRPSGS